MEYKDYYATLGVPKNASPAEIQRAYRKLARKHHPDVNKSPGAESRFKEINEAHQVLSDPEKRAQYDRFGSAWKEAQRTGAPPPGFEEVFSRFGFGGPRAGGGRGIEFDFGGEGFSSFFEALFGPGAGGQPGGRAGRRAWGFGGGSGQGADREARIAITLEEAALGGRRQITLQDPESGARRTLRVNLPAGIRPGRRVRVAAQGGGGRAGAPRGDLYLTVEVLPHPRFRLEGTDLHTVLPVSPWEAALGGRAEVATLDGSVAVRIPPGSSSGRRIRLRGRGFPDGKGGRGDVYAELRIVLPEALSERERALFEQLAASSSFRPRGVEEQG